MGILEIALVLSIVVNVVLVFVLAGVDADRVNSRFREKALWAHADRVEQYFRTHGDRLRDVEPPPGRPNFRS